MNGVRFAFRRFATAGSYDEILRADSATATWVSTMPSNANRVLLYWGARPNLANLILRVPEGITICH